MRDQRKLFAIGLVIIGVVLVLVTGLLAARGLVGPAATPTKVAAATGDLPYPEVPRISVKDARAAFEMQAAVFVDVRGDPWFGAGHIPGALNLTEDNLLPGLAAYSKSAWIITYCT